MKDPKKYNFDPKSLLLQICEVHTLLYSLDYLRANVAIKLVSSC